ncbi:MAG: hypothetical protein ACE5LC_08870 [Candidatus Aminicenantales bacterium]
MNKKTLAFFIITLSLAGTLNADWRSEIATYLSEKKDYKAAIEYLLGKYESLEGEDRAAAYSLLSFLFNKTEKKEREYKWLGRFFETYRGYVPDFQSFDSSTNAEISAYLRNWQGKYPLVTDIGFIYREDTSSSAPPSELVIGVTVANSTYYKLADKESTLKAGQFRRGFNSFRIEAENLFKKESDQLYSLDLKVADLIVRKEIEIDIELEKIKELKPAGKTRSREYRVFIYSGKELLASSRKKSPSSIPLDIKLPPQKGIFDPLGPVDPKGKMDPSKSLDPFESSGSILGAISAIYKLIKDLTKGPQEEPLPPVELVKQISVTYIKTNPDGVEEEVKAYLVLNQRTAKFFSFNH